MAALEAKIEKRFSLASTLQEEALFSFAVAVVIFQQHTHTRRRRRRRCRRPSRR